jgi:hypothetical protein
MSLRDDAIEALLRQKLWIEENWTRLDAACQSDVEKATLIASYTKARDLWNEAETKNLVMNEGEIAGLLDQLGEVRKQVEDDLAALAEVGDVLNRIAKGVEVGSKIVRLLG